ncbi:MAG: hypothetical protein IJU19_00165 [Bacteroidales bacterium]|nr:hypothetical protein [Bacteroidales bacterium]
MKTAVKTLVLGATIVLLAAEMTACEKENSSNGNENGSGGGSTTASWVDLGLPSGLLWASCNLGATTPEGYGNYYAWGETSLKSDYSWNIYCYANGDYNRLTKYCNIPRFGHDGFTDTLTTPQAMDDAATQALGSGARMPTQAEWQELLDNTTDTWATQGGTNGRLLTATNGKSLFLPATGYSQRSSCFDDGGYGNYWTSSLCEDWPSNAYCFTFSDWYQFMNDDARYLGFSVRAVRDGQK